MKAILFSLLMSLSFVCNGMEPDNYQELNEALIRACKRGDYEDAKFILNERASVNARNEWYSALHCAVSSKHIKLVTLLLNRNALVDIKDELNTTPLYWAISDGNVECIKLLLEDGAALCPEIQSEEMQSLLAQTTQQLKKH